MSTEAILTEAMPIEAMSTEAMSNLLDQERDELHKLYEQFDQQMTCCIILPLYFAKC